MAIEHFKRIQKPEWDDSKKISKFNYFATGSPEERHGVDNHGEYLSPYSEVEGRHEYAEYIPTFENVKPTGQQTNFDMMGATGLSDDYLRKKYKDLHLKSYDVNQYANFSEEEGDALDALRLIRGIGISQKGRDQSWAVEQTRTNPHLAPTQLFEEISPARTHISGMFADPSMKVQAMTQAGMAYREYSNAPVEADSDLSPHSSKLVKGSLKKGFPVVTDVHNPTARVTNQSEDRPQLMTKSTKEMHIRNMEPVSPDEVSSSFNEVKSIIRSARPKRKTTPVTSKGLGHQFLPGLEKFV